MKYLIIILISISYLFSTELNIYTGLVQNDKRGVYEGFTFKDLSEDETIAYKIGLREVNFYSMDYKQFETLFSINKELDLEKNLELGLLNIDNKEYGGNIYISILHISSFNSYTIGAFFSKYNNDIKVYQTTFSMKKFITEKPFYIQPTLYLEHLSNKKFYNTVELKLGYIHKITNIEISYLLGNNSYLFSNNNYISCNLGLITKSIFKLSYMRQFTHKFSAIAQYRHQELKESQQLDIGTLSIKYQY